MSKPRVIKVTFIDPYESDDSGVDPDYVPSQTPESEDYSSVESSSLSTDNSQSSRYRPVLAQLIKTKLPLH